MKITYSQFKKTGAAMISMALLFLFFTAKAQLKLYSKGSVSIGSITQPPAGFELQLIGNSVFSNNTGVIASSAYIRGLNVFSTDTTPDYTWWGNDHTGIFHPGLNSMAFSIGGAETMRLSSGNNILIGSAIDNGDRFQLYGALNANSFDIFSNASVNNTYSGINWVNNTTTKAWAVEYGGKDEFFVYGNGQAYAYGWNTISDSSLKENICSIQNALNKVLRLQGVTYNFKLPAKGFTNATELPTVRQMGVLAQAVERVVPEVVTTTDKGIKTVAYSNLVALLIEAIKQEDVKVTNLQRKLDSCITTMNKQSTIVPDNSNVAVSGAKLYPCNATLFTKNTTIHCYIPAKSNAASLLVFDMNGALKKTMQVNGKEEQYITISAGELPAGIYYYSLVIDNKEIDTKKIIITEK